MSTPQTEGTAIQVMFARLEAKLDVALAQHGAKLEQHGQEIAELRATVRKVEDRPVASPDGMVDHEQRLRQIEATPTVSPRALWTALASGAGVIAALSPFIQKLYS